MSFLLPSGRSLELHEPTFGEMLHLTAGDWENSEELLYAKLGLIAAGLTRDEVFNLSGKDGLALVKEVSRIWDGGRPEDQEAPFESGLDTPFTDSAPSETTSSPA